MGGLLAQGEVLWVGWEDCLHRERCLHLSWPVCRKGAGRGRGEGGSGHFTCPERIRGYSGQWAVLFGLAAADRAADRSGLVGWLVGCLTSQQQASVSQGRFCSDNFTCCHTEIQVADQTFHLTQSQYTDTGPTSPSADPITPGAWQGSHWSANFEVTDMTRPRKHPGASGNRIWDLPLSRRTP